jgi:hypothetical protein
MPPLLTLIISLFNQEPDIKKMGFLSSFFKTPPDGFTDVEFLEYDILRSGMEAAPVVRNLSTGAVTIVEDTFTNKNIPFPVIALDSPVNIAKLMSRMPGENSYKEKEDKVNWLGRLAAILVRAFTRMTNMIRYNIEMQAAQVLQTGKLSLTDENGFVTYEIDFKPKASHFPEVNVDWNDPNANVLGDIEQLSDVIHADGYVDITTLIFGKEAWAAAYKNKEFREAVKKDNLGMGDLNPHLVNKGGKFMGYIHIGAYRYDLYLYNAIYTPWKQTTPVHYVDPQKVIFLPDVEQLDLRRYFGGIPDVKVDPVFDPIFGGKIPVGSEYDFKARVYFDNPKNTYVGEIRSRPAHIPFSIDRFGCMKVVGV